jgi:hypothetical protein
LFPPGQLLVLLLHWLLRLLLQNCRLNCSSLLLLQLLRLLSQLLLLQIHPPSCSLSFTP